MTSHITGYPFNSRLSPRLRISLGAFFSASPLSVRFPAQYDMAPTKGSSKGASAGGNKGSKSSTLSSASRVRKSSKGAKRPPPVEVKNKARTEKENLAKKKKRVYTEAELDLPKLNSITPVGVVKPKGKKKGKVFVDDQVRIHWLWTVENPGSKDQY